MIIAWISSWLFEVLSIAQQQFVYLLFAIFLERSHKWNLLPPGLFLILLAFAIYFSFAFIFRSIKPKIQKYLAALYFIWRSIYQYLLLSHIHVPISGAVTQKGLTTPLTRWVARGCYLWAGAVYVVLLGSPTCLITLVSSLREIPTVTVLHHPFLFGEIPT